MYAANTTEAAAIEAIRQNVNQKLSGTPARSMTKPGRVPSFSR